MNGCQEKRNQRNLLTKCVDRPLLLLHRTIRNCAVLYGITLCPRSRGRPSNTHSLHHSDKNALNQHGTSVIGGAMTNTTREESKPVRKTIIFNIRPRNNRHKIYVMKGGRTLYLLACSISSCLPSQPVRNPKALKRQISKTSQGFWVTCGLLSPGHSLFCLVRSHEMHSWDHLCGVYL